MSLREPWETCLLGLMRGVGANGVDCSGEAMVDGPAVTDAEAVLVAGILKLILFLRGEWVGRGDTSSKRTGLKDRGERA